jgi:hypothetical protein
MEQSPSITLRQPRYLTLWALWFLSTAVYGAVWASVIYIWGVTDAFSFYFPVFGGLWLGISQGLVLRHYIAPRGWWWWIFSSAAGWFGAMVILFFGFATVSIGGGLNPETDSRPCGLAFCGLAGAVFGSIQAYSRIRFDTDFWAFTNAFAWSVGALAGGITGFTLYGLIKIGEYVPYDSPQETLSVALGVLVGMLVMGGITGAGAVWQIQLRFRPLP